MANYINETEAAAKVNRAPKVLREKVKCGRWAIDYKTTEGRNYRYSVADLNKLLNNPEEIIMPVVEPWKARRMAKHATKQV